MYSAGDKIIYGSSGVCVVAEICTPNFSREELGKKYQYSYERRIDDSHSAVRFCTSWATRAEAVEQLIADIRALS